MKRLVNSSVRLYLASRYKKLEHAIQHPIVTQHEVLENLIYKASDTVVGRRHRFDRMKRYQDFQREVPVCEYNEIKHLIDRMMCGERDVLWPGQVKWYAKSSGTTSDRSKFIPVSKESLKDNHISGGWDALAILYQNYPDARVFEYKNLVITGRLDRFAAYPDTRYGDVSAIMFDQMPLIGRPFSTTDMETANIRDWEEKIERIAAIASADPDITSIGGVPTWNIVLFKRILEITGKKHLQEVWPNLQIYLHGGVNFEPYRLLFQKLIPDQKKMVYQEVYNASEGFFASQFDNDTRDMMLLLDNGVFYEFIPMDVWPERKAIPLEEVEVGKNYCIVISTNGGLWRYMPGDTITFTSTNPYRIRITGRTKHFINAFGEEVMVSDTDLALSRTCEQLGAEIKDYTVAPTFSGAGVGAHDWMIEFVNEPPCLHEFSKKLDLELQQINSDYAAKRLGDLALQPLQMKIVPEGTFQRWLKSKGKQGAQVKVPRLSNKRDVVDALQKQITPVAIQANGLRTD